MKQFCFFVCLSLFAPTAGSTNTLIASNLHDLKEAIKELSEHGGNISLISGQYGRIYLSDIHPQNPLMLSAKPFGSVILTGQCLISLSKVSNLTIQGIHFDGCQTTSLKIEDSQSININDNVFTNSGEDIPILTVGGDSREISIEHNRFLDNNSQNIRIIVRQHKSPQNVYIRDNFFKGLRRKKGNGREAIQVGSNQQDYGSTVTRVFIASNTFDDIEGEAELISVKSSVNVIESNTVKNGSAAITLRGGSNNVVANNLIYNNAIGLRLFGYKQVVRNNIIVNNKIGMQICYGPDYTHSKIYRALERSVVANNTIIDSDILGIDLTCYNDREGYQTPPNGNTIANNIVQSAEGANLAISPVEDRSNDIRNNMISNENIADFDLQEERLIYYRSVESKGIPVDQIPDRWTRNLGAQ